ncbi:MAG TPA: DUF3106 domain-containing protein [Candidatus Binatia bacterium]|nr:DUF3106 domain-containing protein [Candidatus Binatia bacterium]
MQMFTVRKIIATLALCLAFLQPSSVFAADDRDRWRNLSPRERENVLKNYRRWKDLPPQDKEHLREEWDRWQNLPKDRRDQLRNRYEDLRRRRNQD